MTVSMIKATDGVQTINPGAGANNGSGPLRFIGGVPVRKVNGAVIRLAGAVRCITVEPGPWGGSVSLLHGSDGEILEERYTVAPWEPVRAAWVEYAVRSGIFAGLARLR